MEYPYKVVHAGELDELIRQVNKLHTQGWVCKGGIEATGVWFYQAMVVKKYYGK